MAAKKRKAAKPARRNSTPKKAAPKSKGPVWERAFLAAFRDTGNVRLSCDAARVDRATAYARRQTHPGFAAAWDAAREDAADRLEEEARRRAYDGVDEPVFGSLGAGSGSGEVGTVRKYSDTLLIFLLKGARPEKYREHHRHEHVGSVRLELTEEIVDAPAHPGPQPGDPAARGAG